MSSEDYDEGLNEVIPHEVGTLKVEESCDCEGKCEEPEVVKADPKEKAMQKLRDKTEYEHSIPDRKFVTIDIPTTAKIGSDLVVKFSEKVPNAQATWGNTFEWKRTDKFDPNSKVDLIVPRIESIENKGEDDKIIIALKNISYSKGKEFNSLLEGDYLITVRAYGKQAWQETTVRRIIRLHK